MAQSRHIGSSISLLVLGVLALLYSDSPHSGFLPFQGPKSVADMQTVQAIFRGSAGLLAACALSLLTRTIVGLWLGRLAAVVVVMAGGYLAWWTFVIDESAWRFLSYLYGLPIAATLVAIGLAVLRSLRSRSDREAAVDKLSA